MDVAGLYMLRVPNVPPLIYVKTSKTVQDAKDLDTAGDRKMKLPYLDIHIVRGRNVVTDEKLAVQEKTRKIRNKGTEHLLDKIQHLKDLLRDK